MSVCVCVCVRACMRACVRACPLAHVSLAVVQKTEATMTLPMVTCMFSGRDVHPVSPLRPPS